MKTAFNTMYITTRISKRVYSCQCLYQDINGNDESFKVLGVTRWDAIQKALNYKYKLDCKTVGIELIKDNL